MHFALKCVNTHVVLYVSGLFNFGFYVSLPTLFACFLAFDVPASSFVFIENVFSLFYNLKYSIIIGALQRRGNQGCKLVKTKYISHLRIVLCYLVVSKIVFARNRNPVIMLTMKRYT